MISICMLKEILGSVYKYSNIVFMPFLNVIKEAVFGK